MSENKNLEAWRARFKASKRAEQRKNIVILLFTLTLLTTTYFWWTGDLKFVGRKTTLISAVVAEEQMVRFWRSYYYQQAHCTYVVNGKKYTATFDIWKNRYLVRTGDSLTLKIAVGNPKIARLY
ncbi:hypothetical protein [Flagellimonas myxillae]|uniref:hypothetical protein n=1 Tax=Flagellimonas myxillae TaxID=2942214 RepID=UPI00201EA3DD|nr:hypothetical protein [Muricauda myxillae]MCL6267662.1 hypothetical protein [Muricauda myxillae]